MNETEKATLRAYFEKLGPNGGPHVIRHYGTGFICERWHQFEEAPDSGHLYMEDLPCTCGYAEIEKMLQPEPSHHEGTKDTKEEA